MGSLESPGTARHPASSGVATAQYPAAPPFSRNLHVKFHSLHTLAVSWNRPRAWTVSRFVESMPRSSPEHSSIPRDRPGSPAFLAVKDLFRVSEEISHPRLARCSYSGFAYGDCEAVGWLPRVDPRNGEVLEPSRAFGFDLRDRLWQVL